MKQQLWILNSSLLLIFFASLILSSLLKQTVPPMRVKKVFIEEPREPKVLSKNEIENIYKHDLFGTFIAKKFVPSVEKLVTPIPEPKKAKIPSPPKLLKPSFIPSLKVGLKGIAFSSDENKSVCIVEDETKKEHVFHVGDMIKDSQIIKIAQNRITTLRSNGQHETIFLRTEDKKTAAAKKTWDHIIKKVDANQYEIDMVEFPREVTSLGVLSEMLSLLTTYKDGKPVGTKISDIVPNSIGSSLGLQKDDVITAINDIDSTDRKNRTKIYDTVTNAQKGDTIKISLKRNNQDVTLTYKLTEIAKARIREFAPGDPPPDTKEEDKKLFKLNKLQEREKKRREFLKKHKRNNDQENVIAEIRKRLLDNLQSRAQDVRIRK